MKIPHVFSHQQFAHLRSIVISGLLLLLLTGLFRQTQVLSANQHYQIVDRLRFLERTNLSIVVDTLKTRLSVLHSYDTLVTDRTAFDEAFTELKRVLASSPHTLRQLDQKLALLETEVSVSATLLEDFKSDNAVLQNSISYLPTAIDDLLERLPTDEPHQPLQVLMEKAFRGILRYSINNNIENAEAIKGLVAQVQALPVSRSPEWEPMVSNICRLVQTILRLTPEVNREILQLSQAPTENAIDQLALTYDHHHRQITQAKSHYRLWIYIIAIALVVSSLYLDWTRRNAAALGKINQQLNLLVDEKTHELQQALKKLKYSQSQLIQIEKMSALGVLSAGIAHEINNPISFIQGNLCISEQYSLDCLELLSLYEQQYPCPAENIQNFTEAIELDFIKKDWKDLLISMEIGTSRVKKIIESLQNFSRLDESEYKAVDLHKGLESTLLLLNHRLKSIPNLPPIKIVKRFDDLPKVLCEASAINQVFMNLLSNAIEAFSPGHPNPTITITTTTVTTVAQATHVAISIADNGEGIPIEIQSKIFDPFFTSKPVGQGTGLGLTVSYQTVVEGHNGLIDVASELGSGTEFKLQLPCCQTQYPQENNECSQKLFSVGYS